MSHAANGRLQSTSLPLSRPADIAQRYRISKYPTLKLFRNGMMMKREYRGQRSVSAIADFIRQQKVDPVKELQSLEEVTSIDVRSLRRSIPSASGIRRLSNLAFVHAWCLTCQWSVQNSHSGKQEWKWQPEGV